MSRRVRVRAPAKVNLTLEVLGKRPDGYHEIASVMATCDVRDDIRVGPAHALEVRILPGVDAAPGDDLASRAARALASATGRDARAHIRIRKRIPIAAGLGGGSSDAGAVLRALAEMWGVHADLDEVGARVGSDVPFFSGGYAVAVVSGRGERVEPLPAAGLWIALVTLPARVSTAEVYASSEGGAAGRGRATAELADLFRRGTVTGQAVRALARNDLATPAGALCPAILEARSLASRAGIDLVLSGSGPSLFAAADDRAQALSMSRALRRAGLRARARSLCVTAPIEHV
jgi:4-diphosphocytidyl-2-C-methyl-D-erythritol kinase